MPELKDLKVKITFEADTLSLYLAQVDIEVAKRVAARDIYGITHEEYLALKARTVRKMLAECMAERDAYRARCPVMPSDLGPEHTAARLLSYALANGWSELRRGDGIVQIARDHRRLGVLTDLADGGAMYGFCERHAAASGLAPLDILAAIGAMP